MWVSWKSRLFLRKVSCLVMMYRVRKGWKGTEKVQVLLYS